MLEQLDHAVTVARVQLPCGTSKRLPHVSVDPLEQQHLPAGTLDRDPCRHDSRVVHDRQAVDQRRQLAEHVVRHRARRAPVDEEPRVAATRRRMLGDQLLRQVVLELVGLHPVRTVASPTMDEIREALRDGLREEAAPIARRLAEVKGLSNNVIRRLDKLEHTIDAERDARVDDLALLVDLLTEGWRGLNARLDRIEAAVQPAETNVVKLRESA